MHCGCTEIALSQVGRCEWGVRRIDFSLLFRALFGPFSERFVRVSCAIGGAGEPFGGPILTSLPRVAAKRGNPGLSDDSPSE